MLGFWLMLFADNKSNNTVTFPLENLFRLPSRVYIGLLALLQSSIILPVIGD